MRERLKENTIITGGRRIAARCGIFIAMLFFILASNARADLICQECHGTYGPHLQCGDTTTCGINCHTAYLFNKTGKLDTIKHPSGPDTPMATVSEPSGIMAACATCHLTSPSVTHPYRINTDPGTTTAYPNVDQVCGQCHGGGTDGSVTPPKPDIVYLTKIQLATAAKGIHSASGLDTLDCLQCHGQNGLIPSADQINHPDWGTVTPGTGAAACRKCHLANGTLHQKAEIDVQKVCGQCHGGSDGIDATATGVPYKTLDTLITIAASIHSAANRAPVVDHGAVDVSLYTVSFPDTSTDPDGTVNTVTVNWGDGFVETMGSGSVFTHTYSRAKTYMIYHSVTDGLASSQEAFEVTVPRKFTVSGAINVNGATLVLKLNGRTKAGTTSSNGRYSFSNVVPGTYTITAYKQGYGTKIIGPFTVSVADVTQDITL